MLQNFNSNDSWFLSHFRWQPRELLCVNDCHAVRAAKQPKLSLADAKARTLGSRPSPSAGKCNVCNQVNDKSLGTRYEWYKYVVRVVQLHIFQKVQVTANKMVHLKRSLFWTSYLWFDESVKLQRPPFYVANCQKWVCRQSVASVQWSCGANYYCNKADHTMWKGTKI